MGPPRARLLVFATALQLANVALLGAAASRYFTHAQPPSEALGWIFAGAIVPAHCFLLTLPVSLGVVAAALAAPGRWIAGLAIALYSGLVAAVLLDTQVFSLYRFHLNAMVWGMLTSGVAEEILPFTPANLARLLAIFGGVVAVQCALAALLWRLTARGSRRWIASSAAALVLVAIGAHGLHAWADAVSYTPITRQMRYLPWLGGMTAYGFLEERGWLPDRGHARAVLPESESGIDYPLGPLECRSSKPPPNLLVLVVEEWRFDDLDPVTTPELWRFSRAALRFRNHYSTGNSSRYGIFGLMYGLHGTYWAAALAEERGPVLVREALHRGYRFGVFGSASLLHPEFDRTVFSALRGRIATKTRGQSAHERDRAITDDFLALLAEPDARPFFGFLFFDSPHAVDYPDQLAVPHAPVAGEIDYLSLNPDLDPTPLRNRHRNAVYYVDRLVGEVLEALERRGLLESTIVVVTGDHGEEFNDTRQNFWGHNSNFSRYQTQVPLLLHLPWGPRGEVTRLTSHLDVAPTLMRELFGCTTPPDLFSNGRSLLDDAPRRYVVASGGSTGIAIIERARITLIPTGGGIEVVDHELRPLENEPPSPALIREVADQMGAFYAR